VAVEAVAALLEDDGAGRGQLDADGQDEQNGQIISRMRLAMTRSLMRLPIRKHEGGGFGQRHHGHAVDVVDARLDEVGNEDVGHEVDRGGGVAQGVEQLKVRGCEAIGRVT